MTKASLLAFGLSLVACGSEGSGGAAPAGSQDEQLACEKYVAAGCGSSATCAKTFSEWRADTQALGCSVDVDAIATCAAQNGWTCEQNGPATVRKPAPPCDLTPLDQCLPLCSQNIGPGGYCAMSCQSLGLAFACESEAGGSCTCTAGPKIDSSGTASSCGIAEMKRLCGQ
ncbi:MAG: hypothetical protein U0263_02170 [Polyangiaceae bacterium]